MKPLEAVRLPILARVRRETHRQIGDLAHKQGLRRGPFTAHVLENVSECPSEKFHAAMAAFLREARNTARG